MTEWQWRYSSPQVQAELGDSPQALLAQAEVIKTNPVRKVLRINGLYLKLDTRCGNHLRREWSSAQMLASKGIPTVEHLAIGVSGEGELLITRELPASMTLRDYVITRTRQDQDTLRPLVATCADFTKKLLDAGVFHPDFHCGNLLYVPETGQLVLVDVCAVRRASLWDRLFWRYRMEGILLTFGLKITREDMLDMLAHMGARHPEKAYWSILHHQAARFYHSWPKRRQQILKGHHRFTIAENHMLHAVDLDETPFPLTDAEAVSAQGACNQSLFLAHFFLTNTGIPHRRALAYTPQTGELLMAPTRPDSAIPEQLPQEFADRMRAFGWDAPLSHWRLDEYGIPYLHDLSTVAQAIAKL